MKVSEKRDGGVKMIMLKDKVCVAIQYLVEEFFKQGSPCLGKTKGY